MPERVRKHSRLAIWFVVIGLALSAIGIAYIIYAGRPRELPPVNSPSDMESVQQYRALFKMLVHSFFMFLTFLLGSYLMIRIGRSILRVPATETRTEYVDAWSAYRITQDDIDTTTAFLDEEFPPDFPPPREDREDEPPDTPPPHDKPMS